MSKKIDGRIQADVLVILINTGLPCDVQFISKKLGVTWATARYILMELSIEGKVKAIRTRKSWLFTYIPEAMRNE